MKTYWLVLVVLIAALAGCKEKKAEPTYNGKSLSEWVALSNDGNPEVRTSSVVALETMPAESKALSALERMANDSDDMVKINAVTALLGINPKREAELLPKIGQMLESQNRDAADKAFELVNYQALWKKPLAQPLRTYAGNPGRTDTQKRVALQEAAKIEKS